MNALKLIKPVVAQSAVEILEDALKRVQSGEAREVMVFLTSHNEHLLLHSHIESRFEIAGRLMAMTNEVVQGEE